MGPKTTGTRAPAPGQDLHVRRWLVSELLLRGLVSGACAGQHAVLGGPISGCAPVALGVTQTTLVLSCAGALSLSRSVTSGHEHAAAAAAIMLWSASMLGGAMLFSAADAPESYGMAPDAAVLLAMEVILNGLRPSMPGLFVIGHAVACAAAVAWAGQTWGGLALRGAGLAAVAMHGLARRREFYSALNVEHAATASLVSLASDATFWLAADGDTIVHGGPALDNILGTAAEGTRLTAYLDEQGRQQLRQATGQPQGGAKLSPLAILSQEAPPFQAELFVVAADARGFLVGLRRDKPAELKAAAESLSESTSTAQSECTAGAAADTDGELSSGASTAPPSPESTPEQSLFCRSSCSSSSIKVSRKWSSFASLDSRPSLREPLQVQSCKRSRVLKKLLTAAAAEDRDLRETVRCALGLCFDHARGSALFLIADSSAFIKLFGSQLFSDHASGAERGAPALRTADCGYLNRRLHGIHVSGAQFAKAVRDVTEPSETDLWPEDHPDSAARSLPKGGAFLLDSAGFSLKCAAVLGMPCPWSWHQADTKHQAALTCAWAIDGCIALVRGSGGSVHAVVRDGLALRTYYVLPEQG